MQYFVKPDKYLSLFYIRQERFQQVKFLREIYCIAAVRQRYHLHSLQIQETSGLKTMALKGKAVLICGGVGGIGLATTKEMLREGARVAISDVAATGEEVTKELQNEFGVHRVFFVRADVCDDTEMKNVFDAVKERFNALDVFVNCAGILNDSNWSLEVDINVKGVIRGTLLAWKHMGKHCGGKGGVVVNVSSAAAFEAFAPIPVHISTMHAIVGFSRSCGAKSNYDRTGVRVVAICPRATDTPLAKEAKGVHIFQEMEAEWGLFIRAHGKMQPPERVAKCILRAVQHGASGSVWVSTRDEPAFQVAVPTIDEMQRKE